MMDCSIMGRCKNGNAICMYLIVNIETLAFGQELDNGQAVV